MVFRLFFSCFYRFDPVLPFLQKPFRCKHVTWKVKSAQKSAIRHQLFCTFLHPFLHHFEGVHLAPLGDPVFTPILTPFWGGPKWAISRFHPKPRLDPQVCHQMTPFGGFVETQKDSLLVVFFHVFCDKKREIATLCFHMIRRTFKNAHLKSCENTCFRTGSLFGPKNDHFYDPTVGPCTTFWSSSIGLGGWIPLPIKDGHRMCICIPQRGIRAHVMVVPTTFCLSWHHALGSTTTPKTWFFVFFVFSHFCVFLKKSEIWKNTNFPIFLKKHEIAIFRFRFRTGKITFFAPNTP